MSHVAGTKASVFSSGLALFSMFFGAGNLVFPLIVGRTAGAEIGAVLGGLGISAVLFPLLGLIAMMLYRGDLNAFLQGIWKPLALGLVFVLYMSQGPAGAMPRLITLMHASVTAYTPQVSLPVFSVLICAGVYFFTYKPRRVIHYLGVILTPLLLAVLALLVIAGVRGDSEPLLVSHGPQQSFSQGLKGGYQTLDLTAALLFATMMVPHLAFGETTERAVRQRMLWVSLIAAALLMASYIGLCYLASRYGASLDSSIAPVALLHAIATRVLGPAGGAVAALAVFLACLTTAISLAAVFAAYLRRSICRDRVGPNMALGITLAVTAGMANLGFDGIAKILTPALEVLYPGLIVLCVAKIGAKSGVLNRITGR